MAVHSAAASCSAAMDELEWWLRPRSSPWKLTQKVMTVLAWDQALSSMAAIHAVRPRLSTLRQTRRMTRASQDPRTSLFGASHDKVSNAPFTLPCSRCAQPFARMTFPCHCLAACPLTGFQGFSAAAARDFIPGGHGSARRCSQAAPAAAAANDPLSTRTRCFQHHPQTPLRPEHVVKLL